MRRPDNEFRKMLRIAWVLARSDLKQRYMGSFIGMLWTLLRPLALYAVLYLVFTHIVRVGGQVPNYPIYLLLGMTLWSFFADLTTNSVAALVRREAILRKIRIPMYAVATEHLITASVQLGASLVVFFAFSILSGVTPTVQWLSIVPAVALLMVFAFGIGLILAVSFVYFRDTQPLWEVASQVLFWASPIIYVATFPQPPLRDLLGLNPISQLLTELRATIVDPNAPHIWEVFSTASIVGAFAILALSGLIGVLLFNRSSARLTENL